MDMAPPSYGGDCRLRLTSSTPVINFNLCALLAKPWVAAPSHKKADVAVKKKGGSLATESHVTSVNAFMCACTRKRSCSLRWFRV
jgi:hypothetical protein